MLLTMYGVFCFATYAKLYTPKFIVPQVRFHDELIGTRPVMIARKTAKLFKFVHLYSEHKCTIAAGMVG